jgi:hypothetical protein
MYIITYLQVCTGSTRRLQSLLEGTLSADVQQRYFVRPGPLFVT